MSTKVRSSSTVMSLFVFGAVAVSIAATTTPTTLAVSGTDPLVAYAAGQPWWACEYECRECSIGGEPGHDIVESVNPNAGSSHLENCNEGGCGGHDCGLASHNAFEQIIYAAQYGGAREIQAAVEMHAVVATYNPQRQSVQINCDVGLIANIPLTTEQVMALGVATSASTTLTTEQMSDLELNPI